MTSPSEPRDTAAEQEPVVIRDKRRIDPATGEARTPDPAAGTPAGGSGGAAGTGTAAEAGAPDENAQLLAERTADLQRIQAEYANYRKRADRDRLAAGELAVGRALTDLLPVLDDIDRARAHDDLTGALKSISDHLIATLDKLGLESFGVVGDPFDPTIHEAVTHNESDQVSVATCTAVMRPGYRHRERLLRPAMVGVSDPTTPAPEAASTAEPADGAPPGE